MWSTVGEFHLVKENGHYFFLIKVKNVKNGHVIKLNTAMQKSGFRLRYIFTCIFGSGKLS